MLLITSYYLIVFITFALLLNLLDFTCKIFDYLDCNNSEDMFYYQLLSEKIHS